MPIYPVDITPAVEGGRETMRRLLTIFVLMVFVAWSVPAAAINAQTKDNDPKETESKPTRKPAAERSKTNTRSGESSKSSLLNKLKREVTESKSKPAKYDRFQDTNKDGVSDNVQRQRPATVTAPAVAPASSQKAEGEKPNTTRTKDTSEKKKDDKPDR
ncbi:MAG: hypothetical protein Kow0074_13720 [Candidatus Zixiibacteriota bacterium]